MVRMCYLCGNKVDKNKKIGLHQFPRDAHIHQQWLNACGLNEVDDVSRIYICSCHFDPKDITNKRKIIKLNSTAIPSIILVRNPIASIANKENESSNTIESNAQQLMQENVNINNDTIVISTSPATLANGIVIDDINVDTDDIIKVQSTLQDNNIELRKIQTLDIATPEQIHKKIKVVTLWRSSQEHKTILMKNSYYTPQKPRCSQPRYIAEIQTPDVATPQKARRIIKFMKKINKKKSREIKRLQDVNRRLRKRIFSMQQMMSHLYKKRLISKEAGDTLLVYHINIKQYST